MKYQFDTTFTERQARDYILRWVEKYGKMSVSFEPGCANGAYSTASLQRTKDAIIQLVDRNILCVTLFSANFGNIVEKGLLFSAPRRPSVIKSISILLPYIMEAHMMGEFLNIEGNIFPLLWDDVKCAFSFLVDDSLCDIGYWGNPRLPRRAKMTDKGVKYFEKNLKRFRWAIVGD